MWMTMINEDDDQCGNHNEGDDHDGREFGGSHYDNNSFMITVSVVAFILYHIHLYLYSNLDVKKLFDTRLISAVLVQLQLASVHNYSNIFIQVLQNNVKGIPGL